MTSSLQYLYRYHSVKNSIVDDDIKDLLFFFQKDRECSFLLYGEHDTGKTSLVYAYLADYYNLSEIDDVKNCEYVYKYNGLCDNGIQCFKQEVFTFCKLTISSNIKLTLFIDNIDNISEHYQLILKDCLEQYENKLNLIITCKNIEKIKEYLRSRVYIVKLNKYKLDKIKSVLTRINQEYHLLIDEESQYYLLQKCDYSLVKLFSMLETLRLYHTNNSINIQIVKQLCCYINDDMFVEYTNIWYEQRDLKNAILRLKYILDMGYSIIDIYEMYFTFIKQTNVINDKIKHHVIKIISKYIIRFYCIHENDIELFLFTYDLFKIQAN
jgi:replication-associated recombination protein RarA